MLHYSPSLLLLDNRQYGIGGPTYVGVFPVLTGQQACPACPNATVCPDIPKCPVTPECQNCTVCQKCPDIPVAPVMAPGNITSRLA